MECMKEKNIDQCNCSYGGCPRHGICCECLRYHRAKGALPACYFPDDIERGYDRSIANFVRVWQERKHL